MSLGLEVLWDGTTAAAALLLLGRLHLAWELRRGGACIERFLRILREGWRALGLLLNERGRLALLAMRQREQLAHALVELCELDDESSVGAE